MSAQLLQHNTENDAARTSQIFNKPMKEKNVPSAEESLSDYKIRAWSMGMPIAEAELVWCRARLKNGIILCTSKGNHRWVINGEIMPLRYKEVANLFVLDDYDNRSFDHNTVYSCKVITFKHDNDGNLMVIVDILSPFETEDLMSINGDLYKIRCRELMVTIINNFNNNQRLLSNPKAESALLHWYTKHEPNIYASTMSFIEHYLAEYNRLLNDDKVPCLDICNYTGMINMAIRNLL